MTSILLQVWEKYAATARPLASQRVLLVCRLRYVAYPDSDSFRRLCCRLPGLPGCSLSLHHHCRKCTLDGGAAEPAPSYSAQPSVGKPSMGASSAVGHVGSLLTSERALFCPLRLLAGAVSARNT